MSENEQILKGIDDPEYPIYEIYTDENGNPVAHISRKVTILTQEESKRVLERFKSLEDENDGLRELVLDIYWDYVTDDAIGDGSKLPHYHERMRKLGIEVPE